MADSNIIFDLIDFYINDEVFATLSQEARTQLKQSVLSNGERLKTIKENIKEKRVLQEKIISKKSQLHHVLGAGTNSGLTLNYNLIKDNMNLANQIGPLIYEAYQLTSKILQDLKIIPPVNYTFTYYGKDGFKRSDTLSIDPEKDLTYEIHRNTLIIRLKESTIKHKILSNQQNSNTTWVSKHYENFIKPLKNAESKGRFKINWGVASEAFERHWEEMSHQIETPKFDRFGGVGRIWYLYRISSGNDPYYTGPDTALSQVKNANASIISNADTVLNTIQAVLTLIYTTTDSPQEAQRLKEQYSLSFKQKSSQVNTISRDIWESIEEDVQEKLLKEFGASEAKVNKHVVVFY